MSRKERVQNASLSGFFHPISGWPHIDGVSQKLVPSSELRLIYHRINPQKKSHVNSFTGSFGIHMFFSSFSSKSEKRPTLIKGVQILSGQVHIFMGHYLKNVYFKFQPSPISIGCTRPQILLKNAKK